MQVASLKVTPGLKKRIKEVTRSSEVSVLLITYNQRVPLLSKSPLENKSSLQRLAFLSMQVLLWVQTLIAYFFGGQFV